MNDTLKKEKTFRIRNFDESDQKANFNPQDNIL